MQKYQKTNSKISPFTGLGVLFLLLFPLIFSSCHKEMAPYSITWDMSMLKDNNITLDSLCLQDANGNTIQKVTELTGNKAKMTGTTEDHQLASLKLCVSMNGESNSDNLYFVLEPGDMEMNDSIGFIKGTTLNDSICSFIKKLYKAFETEKTDIDTLFISYITEHKDDVSALVLLSSSSITSVVNPVTLNKLYKLLSEENQELPTIKALKEKIDNKKNTVEGKHFIDFQAEYNGKIQRLSDYVGKGKYVLVDFWASWCGPCRAEVPNIIKVYNKYKGDKFEALGVATWDKPEDTQKAIEEEGINYPQILNAQEAGSDAYSIEGIPEIILFSPDGTILKRGLRGDDIEKAVSEALEQK